jgi:hypothetical protein
MPAAPTHQFPLLDARLQQHAVQVLGRLAGHQFRLGRCVGRGFGALDEIGGCGGGGGQVGEAELLGSLAYMHCLNHVFLWGLCRRAWNSRLEMEEDVGRIETWRYTSLQIVRSSSHIRRGKMLRRKGRFMSVSRISSSESLGCRGKLATWVLHVLTAQVRKLSVRSFIVAVLSLDRGCHARG